MVSLLEGILLHSFLLEQKVIEQKLTFDEMMDAGLSSVLTNDLITLVNSFLQANNATEKQ